MQIVNLRPLICMIKTQLQVGWAVKYKGKSEVLISFLFLKKKT